jgi:Fur family transcriptional regulator, zinc uptake regulator
MASPHTSHSDSTGAALAQVEGSCSARGVRLTEFRRLVLGLLLDAERPLGAYGLLGRLEAATRRTVAPPTVYRALDFLVGQGLAHRIERLNAFAACSAVAQGRGAHAHQFLICRGCGTTLELHDASVVRALSRAAARSGFTVGHAVVEVEGVCARCATAQPAESAPPPDGVPA